MKYLFKKYIYVYKICNSVKIINFLQRNFQPQLIKFKVIRSDFDIHALK